MRKTILVISVFIMTGFFLSVAKANTSETEIPQPANCKYMIKVIDVTANKSGSEEVGPETTVKNNLSLAQAKAAIATATGTPISSAQNTFSDGKKTSFSIYTSSKGIASTTRNQTEYKVTTRKLGYNVVSYTLTTDPNTYSVAIIRLKKK
ncbi:MAG: hypothetical protein KKC80_06035 [Candidatus Margulisbacteria bacterium]|nr:hypothetical protein [Candidatus Margulisiibacteriota bacterium]MBU1616176.1 hypothetical protein [Candidatus Margulisiibacteriota bacterium]MBU1867592.1 hypothetical protein [Candidatus Margulisiibacteriota bacterium]